MTFEDQLLDAARQVRRLSQHLLVLWMGDPRGDAPRLVDFRQHSLVAVFDAFAELGGRPDRPEAFDWDAQMATLLEKAHARMALVFQGRSSQAGAARIRTKLRKSAALNEEYRWDSWRHSHPNDDDDLMQDSDLRERQLRGVWAVLREKLPSEDYRYLRAIYHDGRRQVDLARDVIRQRAYGFVHPHARTQAAEQDAARELQRVETAVNVALHRARKRAAMVLPAHWRDLLRTTG